MVRDTSIKLAIKFTLLLTIGCRPNEAKLEGVNFKQAEYYDSFLFVSEKRIPASKIMTVNFNDWAKFNNSFVTLSMYYQDDKDTQRYYLGTESCPLISLYLNGKLCPNGEIKLNSESGERSELKIEFSPEAEEGLYSGFIIVKNSKVDRINNNENISNQLKIFEWNARFNIVTNPLKLVLIWVIYTIIFLLILWFVVFKNILYPKMSRGTIMINTPYSKSIRVRGFRKLVFSNKIEKQSVVEKIFAGKILYEINPLWDSDVIFYPQNKKSLGLKLNGEYKFKFPNNQIVRGKSYELHKGKDIIKFSFL